MGRVSPVSTGFFNYSLVCLLGGSEMPSPLEIIMLEGHTIDL